MAVLSYQQIQDLWIANGGAPSAAPVMAAIALAENGGVGRTDQINDTPATGDYSVGLWQINYFGSLRPGRTAQYGSPEQLLADPNRQALAAKAISNNGKYLSPWTTYTSNAYKKYLGAPSPMAAAGANVAGGGGGGSIVSGVVGAVEGAASSAAGAVSSVAGGAASAAGAGLNWLTGGAISAVSTVGDAAMAFVRFLGVLVNPNLWRRVGLVLVGALVMGLGFVLINRDAIGPAVEAAAGTAAKAAVAA